MVFEFGMSDVAPSRTMRADNYALSEETKRMRDSEQARLTDHAYEEALRLLGKHRVSLDRLATALLEKETIDRDEFLAMMGDLPRESRSAETVGTVRALNATPDPKSSCRRTCDGKAYRSSATAMLLHASRDPEAGNLRFPVTPPSCACSAGLDEALERLEPGVPRRPDLLDPVHRRRERCGRQGVARLPSGPRCLDEAGARGARPGASPPPGG